MKTNKKKVLKKIEPIFHKVFENKKIKLKFTSSSKNISRWDSLAQINLVVNIEKLFKIRFNVSELSRLKNVGEMIDLIIKKI
jgi:acyl carrier protein|tara:strand:+ start:31 stop:276 length:246 start_codon:yes stop_codon:yes gene_type:complete